MFERLDFRQVYLLTRFTLKSEWRMTSMRAVGKRRKFTSWWALWSIVSYLILGLVLSLFFTHNLDGEAFVTASSVLMLYVMTITASNIFMSFGTGFLSPDEAQLLAPLPVSSETFFLSRLTVLLCYSTVISFLVALAPSISLIFLAQGPQTGLALLLASMFASIAAAMAVIVMYGMPLSRMPRARLTRITGYVQFFGSLITTGSFIILPRMNHVDFHLYTLSNHGFWSALPFFWFGSIAGVAHGVSNARELLLATLSIVSLVVLSIGSHLLLSKSYQQEVADISLSSLSHTKRERARRDSTFFRLLSGILGSFEARAVLMLFRAQFRYDAKFRLSLLASLPIMVIYFIVAIVTGGISDPFEQGIRGAVNAQGLYMVALFMPLLLMQSVSQSENFKASWIFFSSPLDRSKLLLAVRNTLFVCVIIPFLVILAVLFSFFMPAAHALPHVFVLGCLATLYFQVMLLASPKMPFSQRRRPNKGNVAVMFGVAICGAIGMLLLGLIMRYGYHSIASYLACLAMVLTFSILLEIAVRARIRVKLDREEFDG